MDSEVLQYLDTYLEEAFYEVSVINKVGGRPLINNKARDNEIALEMQEKIDHGLNQNKASQLVKDELRYPGIIVKSGV